MGNIFQAWSFMESRTERCIRFKGGSSGVKETEAQRASAEIAMKNYNDYMMEIRPEEDKFIEDVTRDPKNRQLAVAGQINANIAQKTGTPAIDPNTGMSPTYIANAANPLGDSLVKGDQAVDAQRLAGFQSVVDMGMGKNTTAQLGLSDLARQSVVESANDQQINQNLYDSNMDAAGSGLGMAAGMTKNLYDDSKKK